jgi:hypothetical protein
MDLIYIIKAVMIGSLGGGGFYFIIALLLHYFPLPLFIKTQNIVDAWAIKRYETEKALDRIWNIGKRMAGLAIAIMYLVIFAAFTYILYKTLSFYLPIDNKSLLFLYYYLIAIALPLSWLLFRMVRYFWLKGKKEKPSAPAEEPVRKTLLEQMVEE